MWQNGEVRFTFSLPVATLLTLPSGKSTFVSVLLRLMDQTSGAIVVDGVDIGTVSRNLVRQRLICLPQDPLLLPGTFWFNLDPTGIIDVAKIETVLRQVQIWDLVASRGGINAEIPESMSHGEQQLLVLARAILSKQLAGNRCILVLDEATSNLDSATEAVVQKVLQEEFHDTTVIAIAHRLETLRGFDKIVVLDKGQVSRVGPASEVLQDISLR
jgi:ATP-binding cassette subfamily C (CFTR/MRP) protein 1